MVCETPTHFHFLFYEEVYKQTIISINKQTVVLTRVLPRFFVPIAGCEVPLQPCHISAKNNQFNNCSPRAPVVLSRST